MAGIGVWAAIVAATGGTFLALDAFWLTWAADRIYRPRLGGMLLEQFRLGPAAAFYLVYLVGIMVFAVCPALASGRIGEAVWRGGLLGFVAYATYDLTNQATLKGWSPVITAADLVWGTFVTGMAAMIGFVVGIRMLAR